MNFVFGYFSNVSCPVLADKKSGLILRMILRNLKAKIRNSRTKFGQSFTFKCTLNANFTMNNS